MIIITHIILAIMSRAIRLCKAVGSRFYLLNIGCLCHFRDHQVSAKYSFIQFEKLKISEKDTASCAESMSKRLSLQVVEAACRSSFSFNLWWSPGNSSIDTHRPGWQTINSSASQSHLRNGQRAGHHHQGKLFEKKPRHVAAVSKAEPRPW